MVNTKGPKIKKPSGHRKSVELTPEEKLKLEQLTRFDSYGTVAKKLNITTQALKNARVLGSGRGDNIQKISVFLKSVALEATTV